MDYYLDAEFHEYAKQPKLLGLNIGKPIDTIELISIGIVGEDYSSAQPFNSKVLRSTTKTLKQGREYYAICKDFDVKAAWENVWLRENVLKGIYRELMDIAIDSLDDVSVIHKGALEFIAHTDNMTLRALKKLVNKYGKTREQIAEEIIEFVYDKPVGAYENWINPYQLFIKQGKEVPLSMRPEFYAHYADYDWVVFRQLWSALYLVQPESFETGMSYMNPKGFPYYCKDLKQMLDEKFDMIVDQENKKAPLHGTGVPKYKIHIKDYDAIKALPNYPKQENEHNALADAKWNKKLHTFINQL